MGHGSIDGFLCCPECRADLSRHEDEWICRDCGARYHEVGGVPHFVEMPDASTPPPDQAWLDRFKNVVKSWPYLYGFLSRVCSPVMPVGKGVAGLLDRLPPDSVVLNLGSGVRRVSETVINVDFMPFPQVDVVADVARLPFKANSVDGIVSEAALEHVRDSRAAVEEMHRVLKDGGHLYLVVPFMSGYHPSPNDYRRWTLAGIAEDLPGFKVIESGVRSGPTSALLWILQEWIAMALSFNIRPLYRGLWLCLVVLTAPLKLLDLLLSRYLMSGNIAATFYCLGVKVGRR